MAGANYPGSATSAIHKSELPIVLRVDEVESVGRMETSKVRTIAAVTVGVLVVTAGVVFVYAIAQVPGVSD